MIYLVGAGPGDLGLLTLRGYEVLRRADVVIYDRLVGEGILALIPANAERIDAGKSSGSHTLSQREIEAVMIERARENKNVVRLKGGDPFLFGRGGEEAEAIINAGLKFEVVPGVSSALAVPSYSGIPVTHRDYCSGINVFTAHDKNNLIPDFTNTTSIFLMGISHAKELQYKLMLTLQPETECAIIENGTTSSQRTIRTKLCELHDAVVKNNINPPAVIIVGKTASLNLDWRNNLPLHDKRIIITRPEERASKLAGMLRDLGAEVILLPTIKTSIIHDALDNANISGYDWLGFTSVTGVNAFFELLSENNRDIREIGNAKIAAIGQATKDALKSHGLKVDYMPEIFDGKHLAEGLAKLCLQNAGHSDNDGTPEIYDGQHDAEGLVKICTGNFIHDETQRSFENRDTDENDGKKSSASTVKILMLRAENGTPEINNTFRNYGIIVSEICIYRTDYVKLVHVPKFADKIIFTSSSTVKGFCASVNDMREVECVCIGVQTAKEAESQGFHNIRIAEQATIESVVAACT
ncbi:MAG: uroporphyrinogen-III C-methyltransferase [Synergistaceae bacterium]|nr:uroporphyrinogen-III C-methyltransferase [Synergistaceae bacterium]